MRTTWIIARQDDGRSQIIEHSQQGWIYVLGFGPDEAVDQWVKENRPHQVALVVDLRKSFDDLALDGTPLNG